MGPKNTFEEDVLVEYLVCFVRVLFFKFHFLSLPVSLSLSLSFSVQDLDSYLKTRVPQNFSAELRGILQVGQLVLTVMHQGLSSTNLSRLGFSVLSQYRYLLDDYLMLVWCVCLLVQNSDDARIHYNVPLLNAIVLYVGTQAISVIQGQSQTISTQSVRSAIHMEIFQSLATELDTEGKSCI